MFAPNAIVRNAQHDADEREIKAAASDFPSAPQRMQIESVPHLGLLVGYCVLRRAASAGELAPRQATARDASRAIRTSGNQN